MSARKALGKGLGSLIPGAEKKAGRGTTPPGRSSGPGTVGIEQITPSRYQPRISFDDEMIEELAESIRGQGIIEPLVVRPLEKESSSGASFELVAGERRWRAAQKAKLSEVPVVVKELSDKEALEMGLTENLQREDLSPIEEARAYRMLIDEFELKHEEAAARIGVDRSTVTNALRLLKLDADIQDDIVWGRLTAGHARALLQADDAARKKLHKLIIEKELSVRQAESMARKLSNAHTKKTPGKPGEADSAIAAALKDLEYRLTRFLGSKVVIRISKRGGSLEIKFTNKDQLEGICNRIME